MTGTDQAIHRSAAGGFSQAADTYARGRPDYPPEVAGWLRGDLGLGPGRTVVDLGAGTGKFTPLLLETGAAVVAVEPVAQMLEKLAAALPDADARAGTAEAIPLPDGAADAVVCAQAFHWFANPAALVEIRRVLKPGGRLGLIWNVRDSRLDWMARIDAIQRPYEGDTPRFHNGQWRTLFPAPGLGPLHERHYRHGHTGAPEDVILNRIRSVSFIAALPPGERARVDAQLRELIASTPELRGREVVTVPYETAAYWTVKD
jgi:SAM-dependent methyltransferase